MTGMVTSSRSIKGPSGGREEEVRKEVCQQENEVEQIFRKHRRQGRQVRRRHVEVVQQRLGKDQVQKIKNIPSTTPSNCFI